MKERWQSGPSPVFEKYVPQSTFLFFLLDKKQFPHWNKYSKVIINTMLSTPQRYLPLHIINSSCRALCHSHCRLLESCNTNVAKCNLGNLETMCLAAFFSNLQPVGWLLPSWLWADLCRSLPKLSKSLLLPTLSV